MHKFEEGYLFGIKAPVREAAKFLSLFELYSKEEQYSYFVENDECCSLFLKTIYDTFYSD